MLFLTLLFIGQIVSPTPNVLYIDPNIQDAQVLTPIKATVTIFYDQANVARLIISSSPTPPSPPPIPSASRFTPIVKSFNLPQDVRSSIANNYQTLIDDIEHTKITTQNDAQVKLVGLNHTLLDKNPTLQSVFQAILVEANKKKYYNLNDLHNLYIEIRDGFNG